MFGSTNPFGQSSSSPFGSQSVFGQTNSSSNPFAPKPFGSTTPFGSQTGSSIFGGTSTGVFGAAQSSSPFSSTTAFGASSSPAFGSSVPAFGSSSTPAFGSSPSSFGGSSVFGQKPVFGGFGSTPTQTSPFGSANQPSQPAFGSSIFGSSTPFGASSQPGFGATSTPAFGATSTPAFGTASTPAFGTTSTPAFGATSGPAFGATSTPAFGATSTPAFGATSTPAFGSTSSPTFGNTGSAFGVSSTPVFGGGGAFGASSNPMFGSSSTSAFGTSSTPFGASSTPAFGASSTPAFSFGSTQAFGQSSAAFGSSSPFGSTASPFGGQSSAFGSQTPTSTFGNTGIGQPGFGGQRGGSRVASYTPTTEADSGTSGQTAKLESISAMPIYKDKSHEELRWEDYQLGDKGGPLPSAQSTGLAGFSSSTTQTNAFSPAPVFGQSSANPFSSTTPNSNPFAPKSSPFSSGFGTSAAPAFSSSAFGSSTSAAAPSIFGSSTSPFGANSSSTPSFGQSTSLFNTAPAQGTSPFGASIFGNTQSSPLFSSAAPTIAQTGSAFGQNTSPFGQTTPSFSQSSLFNSPSSGLVGSIFSTSTSLTSTNLTGFGQTAPSLPTPFQPAQAAQSSGAFGFSNFGQTQPVGASSFGGTPGIFSQNNFGLPSSTQSSVVVQAAPNTNPFGTLPALPQMSIGRVGTTPSIQYGISSMPALDKPAPVRISSLLTSRHLSQRRIKFPVRKYHTKKDGPKVPFFSDDEDTPTTPKADALFIPRENPRALIICPMEQWPGKASEKASTFRDRYISVNENGVISKEARMTPPDRTSSEDKAKSAAENGLVKEQAQPMTTKQASNGSNEEHSPQKADMYKTLSGHRAGEAAIVYEHGADVEALMPKLRRSDYYTLPRIHELAAKERAEPGFCSHVKDFVVGRQGYGSIRFLGETDVRGLDLETLIQFNNREVIVYMDDAKKPPVGQGLNKPAEVTLLNIKCFDKKTGQQYTEGPKIEKYKEMLKRKAEDQGAEFVSYDPAKGEWKIRVNHFSAYKLVDEDDIWMNV
ncbi:nuclear pore complex protein NUP98A isoform X1 [Abrus precatorius]|uniref:Nucleoporin autopeptidase n=1 Tax=Abrus precatorius TaxID=3816 RepID=A0A8B8MGI3_ABRPR|nr:nuclear pore complex protein NUP98A isoform X1 [Abrus precatorius]